MSKDPSLLRMRDLDLSVLDDVLSDGFQITDENGVVIEVKEEDANLASMKDIIDLADTLEKAEKSGGFRKWFIPGTPYGIDKLPKHREFLFSGKDYHERYASWSNQCLAEGTLVATPSGPVPIEQIKIGDLVFDRYGKPTRVINTFDNGEADVIVFFENGEEGPALQCTLRHGLDCRWVYSKEETKALAAEVLQDIENQNLEVRKVTEDGVEYVSLYAMDYRRCRVYDITVEHPEHFFLLANGLSVSNSGKTTSLCFEAALHATGLYPDWWDGKRFRKPVKIILAGSSHETTRNILQKEMLGDVSDWGTGMLPADAIVKTTSKSGVSGAVDMCIVKHVSGGNSTIFFKSYDQGRRAFEGVQADFVGLDEMPDADVYSECYTRTITRDGLIVVTATPLDGMTPVVLSFYAEGDILPIGSDVPAVIQMARDDYKRLKEENEAKGETGLQIGGNTSKAVIVAGWNDAPWLNEDAKVRILAATPVHLRQARSTGMPGDSGGQVYPIPISDITVDDFPIPNHYRLINGLDPGWNFTGAVFGALDPDTDTLYIYADYKRGQAEPIIHSQAMKLKSKWEDAPCMTDPAGMGRSQTDGKQAMVLYRSHGIKTVPADNSVEAGISAVWERMSTGRLKIFKSCRALLQELITYRRDPRGEIIKENDHCLHPDTLVWTDKGKKRIVDLVGTTGKVMTVDGVYTEYTNVRKTQENQEIVKVTFQDWSFVVCTPDHLFLTDDGWLEAENLEGACVQRVYRISSVRKVERLSERSDVYCMEVPEAGCFAAGENGVIVHNCVDPLRYVSMGTKYARTKQMGSSEQRFKNTRASGIKYF